MNTSNDRQVGGTHYRSEYQHWDFITDHGIGYLEGCASKYVTRSRAKNGEQDLEKALHYIDKIMEKGRKGVSRPPFFARWIAAFMMAIKLEVPVSVATPPDFGAYAKANNLTPKESLAFRLVTDWRNVDDLIDARRVIEQMLQEIHFAKSVG